MGVFGGTFDPIHLGHLVAAVNVRHELVLDRVLLVVANIPWQKAGLRDVTDADHRFAMVEAAVAGVVGLEASRLELDRGGPSYTADTLSELSARWPGSELFCIIGADAARDLGTWERAEEIAALATLAIVNRPGTVSPTVPSGWRAVQVEIPGLEVSSTELRARASSGRPLDFLVPDGAIRCIRELGLYAGSR